MKAYAGIANNNT
jgi:NTP pyrophosphatase (non-canonical NTP hydrolase)